MENNQVFICENCSKEHDGSYGSGRFCCKECKQRFVSDIGRKFITLKTKEGGWNCLCGLNFRTRRLLQAHKKECKIPYNKKGGGWNKGLTKETDERVKKNAETISKKIKSGEIIPSFLGKHHTKETKEKLKKSGGYRKGSGRGKSGRFKGYYCDSSWELAFVIYNLEHNIEFKRNTQLFEYEYNGEIHKYMPDFIIDDVYYEIKGYWTEQWQVKYDSFKKEHIIEVIDKEKIKPYLEYVIQKYGENFINLYENREGSSNGRAEA